MNPFIKLLDTLVATRGYRIIRNNGLGFGGMEAFAARNPTADPAPGVIGTETALPATPPGDIKNIFICFRTCIRDDRNKNARSRIGGHSVTDISFAVARSLVASVNHLLGVTEANIELLILDDRSDTDAIAKLEEIFESAKFSWTLKETDQAGQGASLLEQFEAARDRDALCYFVEDDWLHEEDGIARMARFYAHILNDTGRDLVIFPQEHHTLYQHLLPSFIVAHDTGRWRTINNATHCLMMHSRLVREFWDDIENVKHVGGKQRKLGTEKNTTNKIFEHYPAFSPLAPAAVHFQYEDMLPPLYDWNPLWDKFNTD